MRDSRFDHRARHADLLQRQQARDDLVARQFRIGKCRHAAKRLLHRPKLIGPELELRLLREALLLAPFLLHLERLADRLQRRAARPGLDQFLRRRATPRHQRVELTHLLLLALRLREPHGVELLLLLAGAQLRDLRQHVRRRLNL